MMTKPIDAISLDILGDYAKAVAAYEQIVVEEHGTIEVFANLAFIYWESVTQFTFTNGVEIPDALKLSGIENHKKYLHIGLLQFPDSSELHFWDRYFLHRGLFADFTDRDCIDILKKYGKDGSLVPYFFLYLFDNERYQDQKEKLIKICLECPTAKNNWIKSIV